MSGTPPKVKEGGPLPPELAREKYLDSMLSKDWGKSMKGKVLGEEHRAARGGGDGVAKSMSGGDLINPSVYKGPKQKTDSRYAKMKVIADVGSTDAANLGNGEFEEVQDKRTRFEKDFDAKQAAWQDDFDRNNDAIYHRSFDDGSMHLVSTAFRDGKPVDNHGKAIGGMGAPGVRQYRRHDTQKPVSVGEAATFTPLEEDNSTLRYFAATVTKEHERGWVHPKMKKLGAQPWDAAPLRKVPHSLKGQNVATNEPWIEDVKADAEANMATSCFNRLDDGQNDSCALLFQRRQEENMKIAENRGLMPWHESPVLWRFPSGQAGRSIEYGETAATLQKEYKYTSHIQNGQNMNLDVNIGSTHILR